MSNETTHVRTARDVIRRLRALGAEIDRAVSAAALVRRELHRTFTAISHPVLSPVSGERADAPAGLDVAVQGWAPSHQG